MQSMAIYFELHDNRGHMKITSGLYVIQDVLSFKKENSLTIKHFFLLH